MSNEIRGEDTILGTALARAIDSQPIRSTAFERSRVALRMAGGGGSRLAPVLAAAAAIVLGLALGAALLAQRGTDPGGVATQPTATPGATASPAASPDASPTTAPEGNDRIWVYFALDQLPPVGAYVRDTFDDSSAESRISSRVLALQRAAGDEVPDEPATNPAGLMGRDGSLELTVRVEGDLATVEFGPGTFDRISSSAMTLAVVQQLVYTITEEPGIRRALLAEQGGSELIIDQAVIDAPMSREEVLPYQGVRTEERIALEDDARPSTVTTRTLDLAGGIRFVIEMEATEAPEGGFWSPRMTAELRPGDPARDGPDSRAKSVLEIGIGGARSSDGGQGDPDVARSPLRSVEVASMPNDAGIVYWLGLDDARPWRVSLEPGEPGTMLLTIDIGGHSRAVSDSVAVYEPRPGTDSSLVERTFTLRGAARAFEAHVSWRLKDRNGRELATGFTTASLGTSPVWGTFETEVQVPANASGFLTLEVFWPSPRDGADVGAVSFSIQVR
ncbi:MAG: Gmad2 immunoglobulin-like domain-containing protein [Candidatus Limnocylindria bacterium]